MARKKKVEYVYTYYPVKDREYTHHTLSIHEASAKYVYPNNLRDIGDSILEFKAQSGGSRLKNWTMPYALRVNFEIESYRSEKSIKLLNKIQRYYKGASFTFKGLVKYLRAHNIGRVYYDREKTEKWIPKRYRNSSELFVKVCEKGLIMSKD